MKKRLAFVASVMSLALLAPLSAEGVEFGQDATGDPNAVKVGGASGFLYSERIVITVAHIFGRNQDEVVRSLPYWEREGVIYNPGIVTIAGQKKYKIKKILIPSTFVYPDYQNNIMTDDLAIVILSEDIPVTKKAVLATEEQMKRFVIEKSKVELVGYGITNGSQRDQLGGVISGLPFSNRPPNKLTSTLISPEMVINFYKQYPNVDWKRINRPGVYGIVQHRELKQSHICDGDSGSMFFVEEDNVRYLLGTTGLGLVNNNCPPPEYPFSFPSMSWIDPASKLPTLLKTAEIFVADEKQRELKKVEEAKAAAELKAKQEAEEKARVEAEIKAKLEAEAKIAAEAAAKVAAEAALVAMKKMQDSVKKLYVGKSCPKLKATKTVSGVKLACLKKGKKLVWALR